MTTAASDARSTIDPTSHSALQMLLARRAREQAALYQTSLEIHAQRDLDALLAAITVRAVGLLGAEMGGLYLLQADGETLAMTVSHHAPDEYAGMVLRLGEGLAGRVAQSGQALNIGNYRTWEGRWPGLADPPFRRALGVPLRVGEEVIGVIAVNDDREGPFDDSEVSLVQLFADQAALAIQNARAYDAVQRELVERRRVEAELRASEARIRALIDALPDTLVRLRRDGTYLDVHAVEPGDLAAPVSDVIGRRLDEVIPPELAELGLRAIEHVLATGEMEIFEYPLRVASGLQDFEARLFKSGPDEVLAILRNITERKRTEAALRQAQKLESLGLLAGGIAHDFNNLLVAMLGQASLARDQLAPDSPARHHITQVVAAAERAADVTHQLLAYSGHAPSAVRALDLNAVVRENLRLLKVLMPHDVVVHDELCTGLAPVDADPGQLQQVVMNLILNAAEAAGDRRGSVTLRTGETHLADRTALGLAVGEPLEPGAYVTLAVQDDGSGMDAHTLARIFDPFFTTKGAGRGLGLAVVQGIVRAHGGGLRVASAPGGGSTFELYLRASTATSPAAADVPAAAAAAARAAARAAERAAERAAVAAGAPASRQPLILVIDDEEPVRIALHDIFELEGLQILSAADGRAGLERFREHAAEIGLVLLDLSMPGLSSEETFRGLRAIAPDVRVLLTSGYPETEALRRFADAGPVEFLQKPYAPDRLLSRVRALLAS